MKAYRPDRLASRPLWPVVLAGLAGLCIILGQWSCADRRPTPPPTEPLARDRVPIVRVLLTPQPVSSAVIASTGSCALWVDEAQIARSPGPLRDTVVRRVDGQWLLGPMTAGGAKPHFVPAADAHLSVDGRPYRGEVFFLAAGDDAFLVVNRLDMESYLAGVLAKELYPSWNAEAYRALAVAARTFAMYHSLTFGRSHEYDLGSTQAAQVYGGLDAETPKAWAALRSTHGRVLTWGPPGKERVFMAQYSSCCGGRVNGASVIRNAQDIPPLAGGQACPYCAASTRYRWPAAKIAKADIHRAVTASYKAAATLTGVQQIRPVEWTDSGRVVWVDVLAPDGRSVRLRAEDVRLALLRNNVPAAKALYSMNCQWRDAGDAIEFYDGRGFGHGVGLCQWGAQGQAVAGATGEDILRFYYPGATLYRAY